MNRGGTPLNKQEMRNALYQGNATKLLDELSKMKAFKTLQEDLFHQNMKDKYIILEHYAFICYGMKTFLIRIGKK